MTGRVITIGRHTQYAALVSAEAYDFLTQWRWTFAVSHPRGGLVYARRSLRAGVATGAVDQVVLDLAFVGHTLRAGLRRLTALVGLSRQSLAKNGNNGVRCCDVRRCRSACRRGSSIAWPKCSRAPA